MFQSLRIKNFQSHKDTVLEFSPGVNVIVGQSDSGKSAIVRALNWLVSNRPSGDAFRSDWGGDTSVELILQEGAKLERYKSNSENLYLIREEVFKAFGQGVPEAVAKLLNLGPLNMEFQFDAPFLLSQTAGEFARQLNSAINLSVIGESLSNIDSSLQKTRDGARHHEAQLQATEKALAEYEHVDSLDAQLASLERQKEELDALGESAASLSQVITDVVGWSAEQQRLAGSVMWEGEVDRLLRHSARVSKNAADIAALEKAIEEADFLQEERQVLQYTREASSAVDELLKQFLRKKDSHGRLLALEALVEDIEALSAERRQRKARVTESVEMYNRLMPDVCPLCGQKVKEKLK